MTLPFFATILVGTLTAAACDSGPSMARNPVGPSSMPANMGAGIGTMSMPGMRLQSEFDYLTKMIPHHEEAIARATMLQQGTQRPVGFDGLTRPTGVVDGRFDLAAVADDPGVAE